MPSCCGDRHPFVKFFTCVLHHFMCTRWNLCPAQSRCEAPQLSPLFSAKAKFLMVRASSLHFCFELLLLTFSGDKSLLNFLVAFLILACSFLVGLQASSTRPVKSEGKSKACCLTAERLSCKSPAPLEHVKESVNQRKLTSVCLKSWPCSYSFLQNGFFQLFQFNVNCTGKNCGLMVLVLGETFPRNMYTDPEVLFAIPGCRLATGCSKLGWGLSWTSKKTMLFRKSAEFLRGVPESMLLSSLSSFRSESGIQPSLLICSWLGKVCCPLWDQRGGVKPLTHSHGRAEWVLCRSLPVPLTPLDAALRRYSV